MESGQQCPGWTESPTLSYSPSQFDVQTLVAETVLTRYIRTTAAAAMILSSGVAPSLGAAFQRVLTLTKLIECDAHVGDTLDVLSSPTQLAVGESGARYYRGAIVGNVVVVWFGAALVALVVALVVASRTAECRRSVRAVLGSMRLPGLLLHVFLPLLQPTVMAVVVVLRYAADASDVVLGILGLSCTLVPTVGCGVVLGPRFGAVPEGLTKKAPRAPRPSPWPQRLWSFLAKPTVEYEDTVHGAQFTAMYSALFEEYCFGRHWFLIVELVSETSLGVVGGLVPVADGAPSSSCAALQIVMLAVVSATALAMLVLRPYGVILDGATSGVNVLFALTACVLLVAVGPGSVADIAAKAAMWETVFVSCIPLLLALFAQRPVACAACLIRLTAKPKTSHLAPRNRRPAMDLPLPERIGAASDPPTNLVLLVQFICLQPPRAGEPVALPG
jgi:hypothetical protein